MKETTKTLMKKAELCETTSYRKLEKTLRLARGSVKRALSRAERKGLIKYEVVGRVIYLKPTRATSIGLN